MNAEDKELLARYGEEFLGYVLAIEEVVDPDVFEPNPGQAQILAELREVAAVHQDPVRLADSFELQAALAGWQRVTGESPANRWRAAAGGARPEVPPTEDPLEAALLEAASDAWPSLLVEPDEQDEFRPLAAASPPVLVDHPRRLVAVQAALRDPDLRRLFPGAPDGEDLDGLDDQGLLGIRGQWIGNAGHGGGMQLVVLLANIIGKARLWALLAGDPSWQGLCDQLGPVIGALRALAQGEVARVPYSIGFVGLAVPDDLVVEVGAGVLRAPRTSDRLYLPAREVHPTAIFTTTFPLRLHPVGETGTADSAFEADFRETTRRAAEEVDLIRLAALLASTENQPWSLNQVASTVLDPGAFGAAISWRPRTPSVRHGVLDGAGAERIRDWFARIERHRERGLEIAMRRVLAAAGDRLDPVDGLVDSVVAWENCFGTETETTFRVTAAIACLLESRTDARLKRQRQLKTIYARRSRIVHGALHLDTEKAGELRDEALEIALACMRTLYDARTDLLPLSSADRSSMLMLESQESIGAEGVESDAGS